MVKRNYDPVKKLQADMKRWAKEDKDPMVFIPYSMLNYPQGFMRLSKAPKWFREKYKKG